MSGLMFQGGLIAAKMKGGSDRIVESPPQQSPQESLKSRSLTPEKEDAKQDSQKQGGKCLVKSNKSAS